MVMRGSKDEMHLQKAWLASQTMISCLLLMDSSEYSTCMELMGSSKGGETSGDSKPSINAFITQQPELFLSARGTGKLFYSQHLTTVRTSSSKFVQS